jgi:purine-binding chemotaxis protein CheW
MVSAMTSPSVAPSSSAVEGGKHVLFRLGTETYGLLLLELQEVIAQYEITALPELPEHFVGVVGLRRAVIPVLSLRRRFGLADQGRTRDTRIIVVDVDPHPIGIEVDAVARVVSVNAADIEPAADLRRDRPYLRGMSDLGGGKLAIHLDIRRLVETTEMIDPETLREAVERAEVSPISSDLETDSEARP